MSPAWMWQIRVAAAALASNPPPGLRQALPDEAVGPARRLSARAFARASARFFRHLSHLQPRRAPGDTRSRHLARSKFPSLDGEARPAPKLKTIWRRGGVAARGAHPAGRADAAHRRLMNVGDAGWSAHWISVAVARNSR